MQANGPTDGETTETAADRPPGRKLWVGAVALVILGLTGLLGLLLSRRLSWDNALGRIPMPAGLVNARIALITVEDQLATVNPDGTDLRILTNGERSYQFPAWSPRGSSIAVLGSDSEGGGVYLVNDRPDAEVVELYQHPQDIPVYLYWSPDGEFVSFIASTLEGIRLNLVSRDPDSQARAIASGETSFFWHWVPDGRQVLIHTGFTGFPDARTIMAFVPVDRTDPNTERRVIPENGQFQNPAVASSGNYYSFAKRDPMGRGWLLIETTESGNTVWIRPHHGVVAMGWNPAEDELAFISPKQDQLNYYGPLKLASPTEKEPQVLVDDTVLAFFWSPDGRRIAYVTLDRFEQDGFLNFVYLHLWVVDLETRQPRQLLTFQPSDDFVNELMPFFDNYAQSHQLWSPDSRYIVVPIVSEDGENQIMVVDSEDGAAHMVADGLIGFWSYR